MTPRADAARAYLARLGVATTTPRSRVRRAPNVEDDDIDIEVGAARMLPDYDVEIGEARIEPEPEDDDMEVGAPTSRPSRETVVPEIRIVGDARRASPRIGSMLSVLPEALSERVGRAIDDDDSAVGEYFRTMADVGERTRIPDLFDNENVARMETAGRAGFDAIPFGWGDEIAERQQRQAASQARMLGGSTPFDRRRLGDMETTDRRGLDAPDESDFDREQRRRRRLRAEHPIASAVGTVAGSIPSAVLTPAPTALGAGGRILQAARNNAIAGAVTGAGLSDDDELVGSGDDDELVGGRLGDAIESGLTGGALGGTFQALGEGVGAARNAYRAMRQPTEVLEELTPGIARGVELSDGPQQADAVRRLLAHENAPITPDDAELFDVLDDVEVGASASPPPLPPRGAAQEPQGTTPRRVRPGRARPDATMQVTDEDLLPLADDLEGPTTIDRVIDEPTLIDGPRPEGDARAPLPSLVVGGGTAPRRIGARGARAEETPPNVFDDDEWMGPITERPRRPEPRMPDQGPELRAAAMRGERSFGARGDGELDPSIQAADELNAMVRDYADIESASGGFQSLKNSRIAQAMADQPPPRGRPGTPPPWRSESLRTIEQMRTQLEQITRHAGADARLVRPVGEARYALDEAQRILDAAAEFGAPVPPADVYLALNRANMGVGRAAALEARSTGSGMQHTSAFAEPLTRAYQGMRSFLLDPEVWGDGAVAVQRELNSATAPLLRTGRGLRSQMGTLFQDSGETVGGGQGFRTYETVRPEAVRGVMERAGDDAYAGERALLRAWIENYGEQGQTLARIARYEGLGEKARAMQERAGRLLEILDRAQVEGRAADLLQSVENVRAVSMLGRGPTIGEMVRAAARIESGEITLPEMRTALAALDVFERAFSAAGRGALPPAVERARDDLRAGASSAPLDESVFEGAGERYVPRSVRSATPATRGEDGNEPPAEPEYDEEGNPIGQPFNPFRHRR